MCEQEQEYQWLEWAKELQFIAQAGLAYTRDSFDKERFERIREIAAEIMSLQSGLPLSQVKDLFCNEAGFQTPKLDTRAAIFKENKILLVAVLFYRQWRQFVQSEITASNGFHIWMEISAYYLAKHEHLAHIVSIWRLIVQIAVV